MEKIMTFKNKNMFVLLALVILAATPNAFAAITCVSGANMFTCYICGISSCVFGTGVATAIATLAVIFLGIGAFFGKVNWGLVIMVGVGIAAILGAGALVQIFTNQSCAVGGGILATC
jgi:type IV secretory pathway VirB2 component (pilin)